MLTGGKIGSYRDAKGARGNEVFSVSGLALRKRGSDGTGRP